MMNTGGIQPAAAEANQQLQINTVGFSCMHWYPEAGLRKTFVLRLFHVALGLPGNVGSG